MWFVASKWIESNPVPARVRLFVPFKLMCVNACRMLWFPWITKDSTRVKGNLIRSSNVLYDVNVFAWNKKTVHDKMQTLLVLLLILGVAIKEDELLYFVVWILNILPLAGQHWAKQWIKVLFSFSFQLSIELCHLLALAFLTPYSRMCHANTCSIFIVTEWSYCLRFCSVVLRLTAPQVSSRFICVRYRCYPREQRPAKRVFNRRVSNGTIQFESGNVSQ